MWKRFTSGRSTSSGGSLDQSQDRRDDPLGLLVLHTPPNRTIDIIFIHGLGGTSLRTWCCDRDLHNLWPKLWLPDELPTARILTFGYDSHFSSRKKQASYAIGDFATDLLFRMKYGENTAERLGQVPIAVVTHSMGGLVFKKAFVQGHLNPEFSGIVSMIKGVLFLATPHRGTDLAETLNKVLSTSVLGHSPKKYVTELARRSPTIDELNESFRHHASKLKIFSFYETLATTVGPLSTMIVDKATAVMGYPDETQTPLVANHHDVCKFISTKDPNYTSVIGALRSVADPVLSMTDDAVSKEDFRYLADLLDVTGPPAEDLAIARSASKQGACDGLWATEEMENWLDSEPCRVLWIHAAPGCGKSTLCSLVIERLLEAGHHCSYFFFKYGQRNKQSTSNMLCSIAQQIALQLPEYRRTLVDLAKLGVKFSSADSMVVWEKLFSSILSRMRTEEKIYWVLDGLDEADSSKRVIEIITRAADFQSHVRILIFSRPLPNINQEFQLAKKKIHVVDMPLPDNRDNIHSAVAEEIDHLLSSDGFKAEIVHGIVKRSHGNFLWASLVTKDVIKCRREDQAKRLLDSTPEGMQALYDRMMDTIMDLPLEDKSLAKVLLTWAMHATTPLTVEELIEIYPTEFSSILDLNHTITQVCGQLVMVNTQGQITLVHHSAREYVKTTKRRPFTLDTWDGHEEILFKCLATLCDAGLRRKLHMLRVPQFLPYAATSWPLHLQGCSPGSDQVLDALAKFLSGPYSLAWIHYLAMSGRLTELLDAARELTVYARKRKRADADKSPLMHRLSDLSLIESWAVDLMKLPSKFGRHLTECPSMIYQCIPALSPASSIIHRKFNENPAATLSVSGLSYTQWDHCLLARVSGGSGRAQHLTTSPLYLAVANNDPRGTVTVWDTKLFEEHQSFSIGEYVSALTFNTSGSLLACYSSSKTFVWKVRDWSLQMTAENPRMDNVLEFRFDENDTLMMVTEFRQLHKLLTSTTKVAPVWEKQDPALLSEPLARPSCVAFNNDCTQIAISYARFPVSIWTVEPPQMLARLKNTSERGGQRVMASHTGKSEVVWHPSGTQVICIYGKAFKWDFEADIYEDVKDKTGGDPHGLACSPDGRIFMTRNATGSIMIYDFSSMSLIYRLSTGASSNQICFSLDSMRFYDLKGPYCNVWEPEYLLRLADVVPEQVSDTETVADSFWSDTDDTHNTFTSSPASASHAKSRPAITTVEPGQASHGLLVGHANHDGSINIYDTVGQRKHEIGKIDFKINVHRLAWSPKHDRLAYSLINGATVVAAISISVGSNGERSVSAATLYSDKNWYTNRGRTHRILFHPSGNRLLISGTERCQVLRLPDGAVLAEQQGAEEDETVEWQQHPSVPELLLCLTARSVAVLSWDRLEQTTSIPLDLSSAAAGAMDGDHTTVAIDTILDNHCPKYLLLRTVTTVLNHPRYGFVVLPATDMYARVLSASPAPADPDQPPSIKPLPIPAPLMARVAHALGILSDGRLVFLDRQLWVCTTALSPPCSPSGSVAANVDVRRHFFLPHDWVTAEGLRMCRVLRDGTVLCPCKGQVAVLKAGLVQDY